MRTIVVPSPLKTRRIIIRDIFFASFIALCIFGFLMQASINKSEASTIKISKNGATRYIEQTESKEVNHTPSREIRKLEIDKNNGWRRYLETLPEDQEMKDWIFRIVKCESSGNPLNENSQHVIIDGIDYGTAKGLGQFLDKSVGLLPSTWERAELYLNRDLDIWNEYDQVDAMVEFYKRGYQKEWACN